MYRLVVCTAIVVLGLIGSATAQPAAVAKGMQVYTEQKCAVCHSIAGKGNAKGSLDNVGGTLTADEIREWIAHPAEMAKKTNADRKPPMRTYSLSKGDLDALVAYMVSLKKQ